MKTLMPVIFLLMLTGCQNNSDSNATSAVTAELPDYTLLQQELEAIYDLDQGIRDVNWDALITDSVAYYAHMKEMWRIDSMNQAKVLPVLEKYSWLPKSEIGEMAADAIFYVVQHSNTETIEKYLPQMEELAKQGEASATNAAMMRDRLLMFQGKKQLYGTQAVNYIREDGQHVIWPIEDVEHVNKRRAEVGFEMTVEQNAARMGAIFDPEEELPEQKITFQ